MTRRETRPPGTGDDVDWLLATTNRMLRCRTVAALLDLAYDAIREGLGYDRVGLALACPERRALIEQIGTDAQGGKFYPQGRLYSLHEGSYHARLLADPRMSGDGPGFIYRADAARELPATLRGALDGRPSQNLLVALRAADTALGLLSVDNLISARPITEADAPPLVAFANALATAIENVSLLEGRANRIDHLAGDVRRHIARLEWLRETSRRITAARTLEEVLDVVYDGIRDTLGYDRVGIILFDHERGLWEERRGADEQGRKVCPTDRMERLGPSSDVWRLPDVAALLGGAEVYHTDDAFAETPPDLRHLLDGAPAQQLAVALRTGRAVVGMICVDNLVTGRPIARDDAEPLLALANQVATAVENARLLELERAERSQAEEALRRSNRALATITACHHTLVRAVDEADLLDGICRTIVEVGGYCLAWVGNAEHDATRTVRPVASAGDAGYLDGITVSWADTPAGRGPVGVAMRSGRPYAVQNILADPAFTPWRSAAQSRGYAATLSLPLIRDGIPLGVLAIYAREPDAFDEEEQRLLGQLADDLAYGLMALRAQVERARAEGELRHQALHDALTGLPNRILLQDRLRQALLGSERVHEPLALLLLDLDRFKEVNDTLGHQQGDLLLQQVAGRLRGALRATDTIARLGGDEFAVLLPGADRDGATRVAAAIRDSLDDPLLVEGHNLQVGVSIGIALCPDHGADAEALLRRADVSMYVAKRAGGGHAVYAPEQDTYTCDRMTLVAGLREAIGADALALHYQPKVDIATARVRGVEALVRWLHPDQGMIPPDRFIPLAEQTGLIAPLTTWVLTAALRQSAAWRRAGLALGVNINLSMTNLHDPHLVETIEGLLEEHGVAPADVLLEVTESTMMADLRRTVDALTLLSRLGVRIAVDDYGTGYSSLAYLKRLPVHELKIDKSFVQQMGASEADAAIVASTIGLGHSLGLRVVAEGVEDRETWDALARMGCDAVQGYYVSRPLPANDLEQWLRDPARSVA